MTLNAYYLEGPLSKWTNLVNGWQYRWFVLNSQTGILTYYTSRDKMKKGSRRGCISLKKAMIGIDDEDESGFSITSEAKQFHFQARDGQDREKWVRALEYAIYRTNNLIPAQEATSSKPDTAHDPNYVGLGANEKMTQNDISSSTKIANSPISPDVQEALPSPSPPLPPIVDPTFDFDGKISEADAYLQILINQMKNLELKMSRMNEEDEIYKKYLEIKISAHALIDSVKHSIVVLQITRNALFPSSGIYQSTLPPLVLSPSSPLNAVNNTINHSRITNDEVTGQELSPQTNGCASTQASNFAGVLELPVTSAGLPHSYSHLAGGSNSKQTCEEKCVSLPAKLLDLHLLDGYSIIGHQQPTLLGADDNNYCSANVPKSAGPGSNLSSSLTESYLSDDGDFEAFYDAQSDSILVSNFASPSTIFPSKTPAYAAKNVSPIKISRDRSLSPTIDTAQTPYKSANSKPINPEVCSLPEINPTTSSPKSKKCSNDKMSPSKCSPLPKRRESKSDTNSLFQESIDEELEDISAYGGMIKHLVSQVRIGMDLTKVTLPTFILERRSLLEMFADFFAHATLFSEITDKTNPRDRMTEMVRYYLSSFHAGRRSQVAKKPFNPILGEVFKCHWQCDDLSNSQEGDKNKILADQKNNINNPNPTIDNHHVSDFNINDDDLWFISEQVSHHPPISAFYVENTAKKICLNANIWTKSKFLGLSIGVHMIGQACLNLLEHGEEYVCTFPNAYARSIFSVPWIELGGKVTITCSKTGYFADIEFHTKPFYGGQKHQVTCSIYSPFEKLPYLTITGAWNGTMIARTFDGECYKFLNTATMPIQTKLVAPVDYQMDYESRKIWFEVAKSLKIKELEKATTVKGEIEEKQRQAARQRSEFGHKWECQFFEEHNGNWIYKQPLYKRFRPSSLHPPPIASA